jgi:ubiquinone biosynthesis protein
MSRGSVFSLVAGDPAAFRRRLESFGPSFIKIGQLLALRPDLIPQEYCDELMQLTDSVSPFPWPEASRIIEEELGDPALLFREIDPVPVGSGSLAQVYAATTLAGQSVAIKILRPGIQERVPRDLRRTRLFVLLARLSGLDIVSARELVAELADAIMQEIDLTREAANMRRLRDLSIASSTERIPRVYPELSTSRVLTAELLAGVPLSRILRATPAERKAWNVDSDRLAVHLLLSTLQQIFRYQFFHGDIHPGNLRVLPDQVLGYVDFGLCMFMDDGLRRGQIRYLEAIYSRNVEAVFKGLLEVLIETPESDPDGLHRDLIVAGGDWQDLELLSETRGPAAAHSPVAEGLVSVLRAVRRNHFRVPPDLLGMYRTLLTAETIAWRLGSSTNLLVVGREFFTALKVHEALGVMDPSAARASALNVLNLMRDAPGEVNQILSELSRGAFHVNVQLSENARLRRSRDRRIQLVAVAAATIGVAFLMGEEVMPAVGPVPGSYLLGVLLLVLYLRAFFLWRGMR